MVKSNMRSPTVFISYSHDSKEHRGKVLAFSNRLRKDGINAIIDQYEDSPTEDFPRWMEKQIRNADFVILICTENYYRRVTGKEEPGKGRGVKWEGSLIYQLLYESETKNSRFIPVIFEPDQEKHIPLPLRSSAHYRLDLEQAYNALYRYLTNQPKVIKPEIGKLRHFPSIEQSQALFTPQIASTMDLVAAEYCPKNSRLTLKVSLDDPAVLEQFKISLNLQMKPYKNKSQPVGKRKIKILPLEKRKLLGLMAVSILPLKPYLFKQFFPAIEWDKEVRRFVQQGLLEKNKIEFAFRKLARGLF
jgi:hypothetical protein